MVLSTTETPENHVCSYQVLYYKRKNKVHKSKGVAKMDGCLHVSPAPSCLVQLLEDENAQNEKVYSGIQRAISKQAIDGLLQADDTIVLGQYEVQIVCILSSSDENGQQKVPVVKQQHRQTTNSIVMRRPAKPLLSKHTTSNNNSSKPLLKRRPLTTAVQKPTFTATTNAKPLSMPSWQANRRPPTQPKRQQPGNEGNSDEEESSHTVIVPQKPVATRVHPLFKKRRSVVSRTTTTTTNATGNVNFPGAIGTVVVQPSICKVLRPHQTLGVAFLWNCLTGQSPALQQAARNAGIDQQDAPAGVILADEMGLGKTLMTIATLSALHRRQKEKRFVVVCPSSLVSNWAKEFDKWLGKASQPKRVVVRKGGEAGLQQIRAFCPTKPNQSEVLIISYDLFRMNATILNQAKQIGLLIVDEGHRLKNSGGSLTLTALQGLECDARLLITGTPIQNNLTEFHTLANFVCPGLLGDLASFRKEYERSISAANSKSASRQARLGGHEQSQALDKITSTFMLRRLQKDVLKTLLPPRKEFLLFCRPSQHQCRLYKSIASKGVTSSSSGGATAEALTVLTNLRKLCSHPSLLEKNGPINKDVALSGKVEVLDALLRGIKQSNPDDKIVIVSNFTSALTVIEETILMTRGLPYLRLDGTVPQAERQPLVDTFNRCSPEKAFAFLLSSKAGGCGLNLIGANRLVMFDADFNPATDMQAMARVYRQGQIKPCFVYRMFTSGTVEEVVYQRQIQKGNLATITVDGSSSADSSSARFTKEELRDCFTLKEDCDCDTKRKVGKRWPEYGGAQDLQAKDCNDMPLLSVAANHSDTLRFVHEVIEEELVSAPSESIQRETLEKEDYSSDEDECEFIDDECKEDDDDDMEVDTDEECEFDE